MPSEHWLIAIAVVAVLALAGWAAGRRAWSRADRADPFKAADAAPVYDLPDLPAVDEATRLPAAVKLTAMMAVLRDDCKTCGTDHTGECIPPVTITDLPAAAAAVRVPEPDTAITGTIVSMAERIIAQAGEWHWSLGRWEPPVTIHADCGHAEGETCWLSDLLVAA